MWQELYLVAYRFLRGRGVATHDAEDLAQETLIVAFQHIDGVDPGRVHAWVRAVARNRLIDRLRREARRGIPVGLDEDLADDEDRDPAVVALRTLERESLEGMLSRVPARGRRLLEWRYIAGHSPVEIAAMLGGVPVNTVKVGLYRARKQLRVVYEEEAGS